MKYINTKTNWLKTTIASVIGFLYILVRLLIVTDLLVFWIVEIINFIACKRITGFGVVSKSSETIYQSPNLVTTVEYITTDYNKDRKKVADMVAGDFKKLILESLKKYQVAYINTNNFVYSNVICKLEEDGLIVVKRLEGYKAPQTLEKLRIMNWGAVVRCLWDFKALKRLFRMEEIYKYRLEKVGTA